jgi:hypothetical protein
MPENIIFDIIMTVRDDEEVKGGIFSCRIHQLPRLPSPYHLNSL